MLLLLFVWMLPVFDHSPTTTTIEFTIHITLHTTRQSPKISREPKSDPPRFGLFVAATRTLIVALSLSLSHTLFNNITVSLTHPSQAATAVPWIWIYVYGTEDIVKSRNTTLPNAFTTGFRVFVDFHLCVCVRPSRFIMWVNQYETPFLLKSDNLD